MRGKVETLACAGNMTSNREPFMHKRFEKLPFFYLGCGIVIVCAAVVACWLVKRTPEPSKDPFPLPLPIALSTGDWAADLCNGYFVVLASEHDIRILRREPGGHRQVMVGPKVVEVGFDSRYIVTKCFETRFWSPGHPDATGIPDPKKVNYYIVDAERHLVYGPLSKKVFAAKRKKLGVPITTQLAGVDNLNKEYDAVHLRELGSSDSKTSSQDNP
jgi:Protein of unknown function (DUF3997)